MSTALRWLVAYRRLRQPPYSPRIIPLQCHPSTAAHQTPTLSKTKIEDKKNDVVVAVVKEAEEDEIIQNHYRNKKRQKIQQEVTWSVKC